MVSVILPSYLSTYDGCAEINRAEKLRRAIKSFLKQTLVTKELIVVSDGCNETKCVLDEFFKNRHDIKYVEIKKQPLFSGNVRQAGLDIAKGDIICYLDSDDYIMQSHLESIETAFIERNYDWVYYNDWIKISADKTIVRNVMPQHGVIGTSSIAHLKSIPVRWSGCDGYGHDWKFVQQLKMKSNNYDKIYGCGYVVCHIPNRMEY